jgi:hypothetical protein
MPNGDSQLYNPKHEEITLSQVCCLLDELDGKAEINPHHWRGYHPKVYSQRVSNGDALRVKLCAQLQEIDVTKHSLEMQLWWRDYQRADQERRQRESQDQLTETAKKAALAKLTEHERKLLKI